MATPLLPQHIPSKISCLKANGLESGEITELWLVQSWSSYRARMVEVRLVARLHLYTECLRLTRPWVYYDNTFQHPQSDVAVVGALCLPGCLSACYSSAPFVASASVARPRHFTNPLNAIGPRGFVKPSAIIFLRLLVLQRNFP